jgi:CSLREA domain-containing protein
VTGDLATLVMRHNRLAVYLHHLWRWGAALALLAGRPSGWLPAAEVARAATIMVSTVADTDAVSCTLRDAITAANTDTSTGGCAAGAGADTITFAAAVRGSITLATALPDITADLTIAGPGAGALTVARSAAVDTPQFGILTIDGGATVAIADLTLAGGNTDSVGGGLFNQGTATLTGVTLSGNTASVYGGGVFNTGTATLNGVALSGNTTNGDGGGIYNGNGGTATVASTTFSGNHAAGSGNGGGLANIAGGSVALTNTTFDGNTATTGGGIANGGTATLTNVTLGGGLTTTAGTARLINTIVATDQGGTTCTVGGGVITDSGHNIDGAATCGFSDPSSRSTTDPLLDPLAANGGPTPTRAPRLDSPLIDAGDDYLCPFRDQPHHDRPLRPIPFR